VIVHQVRALQPKSAVDESRIANAAMHASCSLNETLALFICFAMLLSS
jgi:hypothetical protein